MCTYTAMEQYLPMREIITNDEKDGIWDLFLNTYTYIKKDGMWTTRKNKYPQEENSSMLFGIPGWKEEELEGFVDSDGEEMVPFYADDDGIPLNDDPVVVNYPQIPLVKEYVIPRFYDLRTKITIGGRRGHHRDVIDAIAGLTEDQFLAQIQEQFDAQLKQWWLETLDRQEYFENTFKITKRIVPPYSPPEYDWVPWAGDLQDKWNALLEQRKEKGDFYANTTYEQYYNQGVDEFKSLLGQYPDGYEEVQLKLMADDLEYKREAYKMIQDEIDEEMRKIEGIDEREEDEEVVEGLIHSLEMDLRDIQRDIDMYVGTPGEEGIIATATKHLNISPKETDEFGTIQGKYLQDKYETFKTNYSRDRYSSGLIGYYMKPTEVTEIENIKEWFYGWDKVITDVKEIFGDIMNNLPSEWTIDDADLKPHKITWMKWMDKSSRKRKERYVIMPVLEKILQWKAEKDIDENTVLWTSIRMEENDDSKFFDIMFTLFTRWIMSNREFNWKTLKKKYKELNKTYIGSGKRREPPTGRKPPQKRGRTRTRGGKSRSRSRSGSVQLQINTMRDPKTGRVQFPSSSPKGSPPPGLEGKKLPPEGGGGSSSRSMDVDTQEQTHINIKF